MNASGTRRTAIFLGLNLLVGLGGLAYLLRVGGRPALALLARYPSWPLLGAAGCTIACGMLLYGLRWRLLVTAPRTVLPLGRLAVLRAAGQSVSALIPSGKVGGDPLRIYYLSREGVPGGSAIASVAIDRALEMGANTMFACVFAAILLRFEVPELAGAMVTVGSAGTALVLGTWLAARRLQTGAGVATTFARITRLARLPLVSRQLHLLADADDVASRLIHQRGRVAAAFALGVVVNLLVVLEVRLLLGAFGLPAELVAVVAAIFASGAAHSLPVPAAAGTLEGAVMWIFGVLGHPGEVGLAAGLAMRLREVAWSVPGLLYMAQRGLRSSGRSR
jgi:hypothetical protein